MGFIKKVSLVLIIAISFNSCTFFKGAEEGNLTPLKAIPIDASAIIVINDLDASFTEITEKNEFWQSFQGFKEMKQLNKMVTLVDSMKIISNAFSIIFSTNPIYISYHAQGNDKIQSVFYMTPFPVFTLF